MKELIIHAIDWTSVKLGTVSMLGFFGAPPLQLLSAVAIASTIIYNTIRIYKELKVKK